MGIYSGSNIRRTARFFGTAALFAAPLFAVLGLAGLLGLGSFGGVPTVEILSSAPAGSPVELRNSVHGDAVWGQPDVDLAAVTCEASSCDGSRTVDLPIGAQEGSLAQVEGAQGTGTWTRLATTDALDRVSLGTCTAVGWRPWGSRSTPGTASAAPRACRSSCSRRSSWSSVWVCGAHGTAAAEAPRRQAADS